MSPAIVHQTPALGLAVDRHGRSAVITHLDRSRDKVPTLIILIIAYCNNFICIICTVCTERRAVFTYAVCTYTVDGYNIILLLLYDCAARVFSVVDASVMI